MGAWWRSTTIRTWRKRLAESGAFAAVFSGHDHQRYIHRVGETVWANPGELMGRDGAPSFGIYDTEAGEFRHVILGLE